MSSTATSDTQATAPDSKIVIEDSLSYWNSISPDVNGMLGGYPQISRIDLQGSRNFIAKLRRQQSSKLSSRSSSQQQHHHQTSPSTSKLPLTVDCGAGIGRITEGLLTTLSEVVDIVEPIEKFATVLSTSPLRTQGQIGDVYIQGLETWHPTKHYDLIWNQWCLGHLTDTQLTAYLSRASHALTATGFIVVKENLSTHPFAEDLFDDLDSSVTRSDVKFRSIFDEAGLELVRAEVQTGFPKGLGLYPVKMYALRPR